MEKIPPFGEEPTKEILVSLDAGEKVDVPIKKIEKKPSGLLNKIRRVIGVGAVAAAALGGEACSPNAEKTETSDTQAGISHVEKSNRTSFSGYGISTETENGAVKKSQFGEEKNGKKTFGGYGIKR